VNALIALINYSQSDIVTPAISYLKPRVETKNGLSALLNFKKDYPACAIHMPNDKKYCELTLKQIERGHKKWVRYAKWFRIWKWIKSRNDCDDAAYEYSNYFHRLYDNPMVVVAFDYQMKHAYIILWMNKDSYIFIEPRLERLEKSLGSIISPQPTRLERV